MLLCTGTLFFGCGRCAAAAGFFAPDFRRNCVNLFIENALRRRGAAAAARSCSGRRPFFWRHGRQNCWCGFFFYYFLCENLRKRRRHRGAEAPTWLYFLLAWCYQWYIRPICPIFRSRRRFLEGPPRPPRFGFGALGGGWWVKKTGAGFSAAASVAPVCEKGSPVAPWWQ